MAALTPRPKTHHWSSRSVPDVLSCLVSDLPDFEAKIVNCPACGGPSVYGPRNRYRPFCNERCKNIDLGAWASESFRVPAPADPMQDPDANLDDFAAQQGLPH